jgi:hypothetical protein
MTQPKNRPDGIAISPLHGPGEQVDDLAGSVGASGSGPLSRARNVSVSPPAAPAVGHPGEP